MIVRVSLEQFSSTDSSRLLVLSFVKPHCKFPFVFNPLSDSIKANYVRYGLLSSCLQSVVTYTTREWLRVMRLGRHGNRLSEEKWQDWLLGPSHSHNQYCNRYVTKCQNKRNIRVCDFRLFAFLTSSLCPVCNKPSTSGMILRRSNALVHLGFVTIASTTL